MSEDIIYPSMVIRSQAEAIELLEKENKDLKDKVEKLEKQNDKLRKKNKLLKEHWNKLKDILEYALNDLKENDVYDRTQYEIGQIIALETTIDKMNELGGKSE